MKLLTLTTDDNIRFLRDLTQDPDLHLFDHPYTAMWKRLHEQYGVKVQCNLFFRDNDENGFCLSRMTDRLLPEFEAASDWFKCSFHARQEYPGNPYRDVPAEHVLSDCLAVNREILRFAGKRTLAATTTVHYCSCPADASSALRQAGVKGLLGLFGTAQAPRTSYGFPESDASALRSGTPVWRDGILYADIPVILDRIAFDEIPAVFSSLTTRRTLSVLIHEQYFYPDYHRYQPDYEQKVSAALRLLTDSGFVSTFLEEWLTERY